MLIGVFIGMLANMIGGLSGWKQGTIAVLLCLVFFFIHLHRLYQSSIQVLRGFPHASRQFLSRIWTRSSTEAATTSDTNTQSISTRF